MQIECSGGGLIVGWKTREHSKCREWLSCFISLMRKRIYTTVYWASITPSPLIHRTKNNTAGEHENSQIDDIRPNRDQVRHYPPSSWACASDSQRTAWNRDDEAAPQTMASSRDLLVGQWKELKQEQGSRMWRDCEQHDNPVRHASSAHGIQDSSQYELLLCYHKRE